MFQKLTFWGPVSLGWDVGPVVKIVRLVKLTHHAKFSSFSCDTWSVRNVDKKSVALRAPASRDTRWV